MNSITGYRAEMLPSEFVYPKTFSELVGQPRDVFYPWVFIEPESEYGHFILGLTKARGLVPFAKNEDTDGDIACLAADQTSGNPTVTMLVLDGSGRAYSFPTFEDWLVRARDDFRKHHSLGPVSIGAWQEVSRSSGDQELSIVLADPQNRYRYLIFSRTDRGWRTVYESGLFAELEDALRDARTYFERA